MLIEIRELLRSRTACSLQELTTHFKASPDAMRGMLTHWQRKGRVVQTHSGCQQGCASCTPEQLEIYYWQSTETLIPLAEARTAG